MIRQQLFEQLKQRISEPRKFIQVLVGPRQVGKTTLVQQLIRNCDIPTHYASADAPGLEDEIWLDQQWQQARQLEEKSNHALLIIDEIQKIADWSAIVKKLYDQDTHNRLNLKVILLGSSPLLLQQGLTESLAGRFEVINVNHWSYQEMQEAFDFTLEQYIFFGGYPGAAEFINDEDRWRNYINDSLIETTISRDILLMTRIEKPALLRRLFQLGCQYSGQILSFKKMLGQLQDAGNTTTLSHYLSLLSGAGMLTGLQKYSGEKQRLRKSIPKLQVLNTALMSAQQPYNFSEAKANKTYWGRLVESTVGASLINSGLSKFGALNYWKDNNNEVDFVLAKQKTIIGIEVKSGDKKLGKGLGAFKRQYPKSKLIQIGGEGRPLADFFNTDVQHFIEKHL